MLHDVTAEGGPGWSGPRAGKRKRVGAPSLAWQLARAVPVFAAGFHDKLAQRRGGRV